jgi:chorismate mutase
VLDQWRDEIDALDSELVRLLNERAQLALNIGQVKRQRGLPVRNPERERAVLEHIDRINSGPLDAQAMGTIFRTIMEQCRRLEEETAH